MLKKEAIADSLTATLLDNEVYRFGTNDGLGSKKWKDAAILKEREELSNRIVYARDRSGPTTARKGQIGVYPGQ